MKTKTILATTAAAAVLFASGPAFAADANETQPQAKVCYRFFHKVPFPIRVRCPEEKPQTPNEPAKSGPEHKQAFVVLGSP